MNYYCSIKSNFYKYFRHSGDRLRALIKCLILIHSIFVSLPFAFSQEHPQKSLFGDQYDWIEVGVNTNAKMRIINPNLETESFGFFKLPSLKQFFSENYDAKHLTSLFGVGQKYSEEKHLEFVPPETNI